MHSLRRWFLTKSVPGPPATTQPFYETNLFWGMANVFIGGVLMATNSQPTSQWIIFCTCGWAACAIALKALVRAQGYRYVLLVVGWALIGATSYRFRSVANEALVAPVRLHSVKLSFIESRVLTAARRDRIADEMDLMYHYYDDRGLKVPTDSCDELKFGSKPIMVTTSFKLNPQVVFIGSTPITISEDRIDAKTSAAEGYSLYALRCVMTQSGRSVSATR